MALESRCMFIMLCGMPGSGKSSYARRLIENEDDVEIICHDAILKENMRICSSNRTARKKTHEDIVFKLSNLMSSICIYDSVCANSEGRLFLMSLIPPHYTKRLIYFTPPMLHNDAEIGMYVDWLHSVRKVHQLFPTDKDKAISTIRNIKGSFEEISELERDSYEIIVYESYFTIKN